jgi:hypothetical protein
MQRAAHFHFTPNSGMRRLHGGELAGCRGGRICCSICLIHFDNVRTPGVPPGAAARPPASMKTNYGCCNICGQRGKLTDDHVPPRGSLDVSHTKRVWVQELIPKLAPASRRIRHLSQNGLKFRTLCGVCNNQLLGKTYDPALHQFSRKTGQIIRVSQKLALPPQLTVEIEPATVAKAVIGHLLAAEHRADMTIPPPSAPMQDAMRSYVRDPSSALPRDLRIFAWPYWGRRQTVLRGVGVLFDFGLAHPPRMLVGDFLKYFPLAFLVTHDLSPSVSGQFLAFELPARTFSVGQSAGYSLPTHRERSIRPSWPESPSSRDALMLQGDVCIVAEMDT